MHLTLRTRNALTDGSNSIGINLTGSSDASNLEFKTQGTGTITLQTGTSTLPQAANIDIGRLTTGGGQVAVNASGNICVSFSHHTAPTPSTNGNISIGSSGGAVNLSATNPNAMISMPSTL